MDGVMCTKVLVVDVGAWSETFAHRNLGHVVLGLTGFGRKEIGNMASGGGRVKWWSPWWPLLLVSLGKACVVVF